MDRRSRFQNHVLLNEADAILRNAGSAILTRNTGRAGRCKGPLKEQARAKTDARRLAAEKAFRAMPKEQRKVLTERFKADREAQVVTRVSWQDWLHRELEKTDGLSLQRTPSGDDPGHQVGR